MFEHEVVTGHFTLDDYMALPEGPPYYELENGELVPVKSTHAIHGLWMGRLFAFLDRWCRHNGGFVSQEVGTLLVGDRGYIPDIAYLAPGHDDRMIDGRIHGVPDLAVEIYNREGARRDRVQKFTVYQECGVPWYWLVDYDERILEEFHLEGTAYARTAAAGVGDEFKPQAMPGLVIPVDALT